MERYSDKVIEVVNELYLDKIDYYSEYLPLIDSVNRLFEVENILCDSSDLDKLSRIMMLYSNNEYYINQCVGK